MEESCVSGECRRNYLLQRNHLIIIFLNSHYWIAAYSKLISRTLCAMFRQVFYIPVWCSAPASYLISSYGRRARVAPYLFQLCSLCCSSGSAFLYRWYISVTMLDTRNRRSRIRFGRIKFPDRYPISCGIWILFSRKYFLCPLFRLLSPRISVRPWKGDSKGKYLMYVSRELVSNVLGLTMLIVVPIVVEHVRAFSIIWANIYH